MSPVVKFPDMRPPPRPKIAPLPSLAEYRQIKPTLATKDTSTEMTPVLRRFRRKTLFIGFGVAVALHAALLAAFFLTPPMRLKWNPPPEDWVPVVSLPKPKPAPPPTPMAAERASEGRPAVPSRSAKHRLAKPGPPQPQPASSS